MFVVAVLLGLDGGLRRGEILALKWTDVDLKRGLLTIRHNLVRGKVDLPKGRTEDEVGLTMRLTETLRGFPASGPFVLDNRGSHFREHNIKSWMETLVKRAGLSWRGTHVLRKSCGTRIAEGGGGVAAVASHLRHKDLQTASDYVDRRRGSAGAIHALETSGRRTSEHS
ncbi:site-specific integrase [Nannocystis sp. ILAH1]|nr:site-specific integrase [Nannocystis sp. ILAH1]MCY0991075.1 site-specific integrase [Nannocystis sp. ILAH1]